MLKSGTGPGTSGLPYIYLDRRIPLPTAPRAASLLHIPAHPSISASKNSNPPPFPALCFVPSLSRCSTLHSSRPVPNSCPSFLRYCSPRPLLLDLRRDPTTTLIPIASPHKSTSTLGHCDRRLAALDPRRRWPSRNGRSCML